MCWIFRLGKIFVSLLGLSLEALFHSKQGNIAEECVSNEVVLIKKFLTGFLRGVLGLFHGAFAFKIDLGSLECSHIIFLLKVVYRKDVIIRWTVLEFKLFGASFVKIQDSMINVEV